jgi:tripeptide aminopeptidase
MNSERLLQRFLRYVRIDTTARAEADDYPSSPGQLELGRLLVEELHAAGVADAGQDDHGIVLATIPATINGAPPVVALCAHLDTSPETTGKDVRPQVIRNYAGGDLVLPGDPGRVIRCSDNPELANLLGQTLMTSDGTTLLGADDKAGVAILMETAAWLMEHRQLRHGPVRLCFTCDEEIGRGVDHLDTARIGATVCYTLDGHGSDLIDVETFSADLAEVIVRGINIHPSIAKGRMSNAVRAAARFLDYLPQERLSPETTEDREGFLHPYQISGGVAEVKLHVLLRDFLTPGLDDLAATLREAAERVNKEFPSGQVEVRITPQYRNMAEGLRREPRAVAYAQRALARLNRQAKLTIVRGGTDGSRLTELGLPTPNLSCGAYMPHSPLEWACLEEMVQSVEWLIALAELWAEDASGP